MITLDVEQNTVEWQEARRGLPTASGFDKILTTKGEPSKQSEKYAQRLAAERVSGIIEDSYKNGYMDRGHALEDEARSFYEMYYDCAVQKVGLCYKDKKKLFACSPDGLVGEDGLLEIKCPISSTHVNYLMNGKLLEDYFQQVQGQLFVTGRKWCDLMSYYPGLKPLIVRVERDEAFLKNLEDKLKAFCALVENISTAIKVE